MVVVVVVLGVSANPDGFESPMKLVNKTPYAIPFMLLQERSGLSRFCDV